MHLAAFYVHLQQCFLLCWNALCITQCSVPQAWKDLLQNTVEDSMPAALFLEQESPVLHVSVHAHVCVCLCVCLCVRARVCVGVQMSVEGNTHSTEAIMSTCCAVLIISEFGLPSATAPAAVQTCQTCGSEWLAGCGV